MEDTNIPVFSQAKLEYTKQLVDILYMNMYDGIRSIYDDSKRLYAQKTTSIIYIFRSLLENVPKWNSEVIESETERIMKTSKCDWLDDLLTAVFISHTRILMSIGPNQNYNKINVTIPKTTTFIHKTYINIAREVWKNPYLFNEQVPGHEYQRNMKQLEDMIKLTIEDTIRRQLPIKEILREHLETYDEPKQPNTQPLDMKVLMNEIKKVASQSSQLSESSEPSDIPDEPEQLEEPNQSNELDSSEKFNESIFKKEEDTSPSTTESISDSTTELDNNIIKPTSTDIGSDINIYNDPADPNEDQIKAATQNIVLNDITEPVVEQTYDNSDIINTSVDTSKPNNLEKLMEELKNPNNGVKPIDNEVKLDVKPIDNEVKLDVKPIGTNFTDSSKPTSVIKVDDPMIPTISTIPTEETVKKIEEPTPLSFNSLYPGLGKVQDITKQEDVSKPGDSSKPGEINASVM
jgi:hypothetical protein